MGGVFQNPITSGFAADDTALGRLAADSVRYAAGADIALVTADSLDAYLQTGELTESALEASFPKNDEYSAVSVPLSAVTELLEQSYAHAVLDVGSESLNMEKSAEFKGYFHVSGIMLQWDPTAPEGERVYSIKRGSEELDTHSEDIVILAVPCGILEGEFGYTALAGIEGSEIGTLRESVWKYAESCGTIEPDSAKRIRYIGVNGASLISDFPREGLIALIVILGIFACTGLKYKRKVDFER